MTRKLARGGDLRLRVDPRASLHPRFSASDRTHRRLPRLSPTRRGSRLLGPNSTATRSAAATSTAWVPPTEFHHRQRPLPCRGRRRAHLLGRLRHRRIGWPPGRGDGRSSPAPRIACASALCHWTPPKGAGGAVGPCEGGSKPPASALPVAGSRNRTTRHDCD